MKLNILRVVLRFMKSKTLKAFLQWRLYGGLPLNRIQIDDSFTSTGSTDRTPYTFSRASVNYTIQSPIWTDNVQITIFLNRK